MSFDLPEPGEPPEPTPAGRVPTYALDTPDARIYVGDCREILRSLTDSLRERVDLIFADPPFNWNRRYDQWDDAMPRQDYLEFTAQWIDICIELLRPGGSFWVNIPDDTAAEIVMHMKSRGLQMRNWCIWHYRFGQNTRTKFLGSKVHALYFSKAGAEPTWNLEPILEASDRATTYFDARTLIKKDGVAAGKRVPMDVWYGKFWGRVQGNNRERRGYHDNQLPEVYLERVILATSNEGDLVLDPFLGSGTTGVMAHALKRRFIGTEFSAANAASAFERMRAGPVPRAKGPAPTSAIFAPRKTKAPTIARFKHVVQVPEFPPPQEIPNGAGHPAADRFPPATVARLEQELPVPVQPPAPIHPSPGFDQHPPPDDR